MIFANTVLHLTETYESSVTFPLLPNRSKKVGNFRRFFARMKKPSMFLTLIERRYKNYPVVSVGMFVERLFPMEKTSGRGPERHD